MGEVKIRPRITGIEGLAGLDVNGLVEFVELNGEAFKIEKGELRMENPISNA